MARFGTQPQQGIVNMFNPINLDFYQGLLSQAQGNLNQGEAMKAKILEDTYGLKHIDEATHKAQVADVERKVADLTSGDFVSPAEVIKGISKASQGFAPYKNLVEKQLEEVKKQEEKKIRWGSNWIGNDLSKLSLTDPNTGQLISPEKVAEISGNREDLTSAFAKDMAGLADKITEVPGGWRTILGGKAYEKKTTKIKGLTEDQRITLLKKGELAKQYMEQLPGFAEAVKASGKSPEEYIAKELDTWTKQLVKGQETDSKYMDNPGWKNPGSNNSLSGNRFVQELIKEKADEEVTNDYEALKEARKNPKVVAEKMNNSIGNKAIKWSGVGALWNPVADIWNWEGEQLGINAKLPKINTAITPEKVYEEAKKQIDKIKIKYSPVYKKLKASGKYGNDRTGYDYGKLENALLDETAWIESSMRQLASIKAEVSPTDIPNFYHSILNKTDGGDILKKINPDGTVADEGESYEELISKGKLLPQYQEASITINPRSGRPEITNVATKEKFAVDRNRLDIYSKGALELAEKAYAKHEKMLMDGSFYSQTPEQQSKDLQDLQEIANNAYNIFIQSYK